METAGVAGLMLALAIAVVIAAGLAGELGRTRERLANLRAVMAELGRERPVVEVCEEEAARAGERPPLRECGLHGEWWGYERCPVCARYGAAGRAS